MLKNWNWKHTLFTLCGIGIIVDQALLQWGNGGNPLPYHLTTAGLAVVGTYLGYISEKLGGSTSA